MEIQVGQVQPGSLFNDVSLNGDQVISDSEDPAPGTIPVGTSGLDVNSPSFIPRPRRVAALRAISQLKSMAKHEGSDLDSDDWESDDWQSDEQ